MRRFFREILELIGHHSVDGRVYTALVAILETQMRMEERLEILERRVTHFTPIKELSMVPLAAGQTATFATTPIPDGTAPDPSKITWSSSDTTNAPVTPSAADPSGLSAQVAFPSTVTEGLTFILTINYQNADGTFASQANSFTTVAAPPSDITGFTDIQQTA